MLPLLLACASAPDPVSPVTAAAEHACADADLSAEACAKAREVAAAALRKDCGAAVDLHRELTEMVPTRPASVLSLGAVANAHCR